MEKHIKKILNLELLNYTEIEEICTKAIEILITEPNLVNVKAPVNVIGDVHGQIYDLVGLFKIDGIPKYAKYIFLGDYIDKGNNSVEVLLLLLIYKILYPTNIYLIRGNHEQQQLTKTYGFYYEIMKKYNDMRIWKMFCEVFVFFNIGCIIDGRVMCVHGGISPLTMSLNAIRRIDRFSMINIEAEFQDIVWSDPSDELGFTPNKRNVGWYYGSDVTNNFLECNDLTSMIRSHQLVLEGYRVHFPEKNVVTVWGAPNYIGKVSNPASFMRVKDDLVVSDQRLCIYAKSPQTLEMLNSLYQK